MSLSLKGKLRLSESEKPPQTGWVGNPVKHVGAHQNFSPGRPAWLWQMLD